MSNSHDWFPWMEANAEAPEAKNNGLPITEPPCKKCVHFKPQVEFRRTRTGFKAEGVRICHADDMHHDFSCFKMIDITITKPPS